MFKSENVLRLDRDEKVINELSKYLENKGISSAFVIGIIGSVQNVKLAKLTQDTSKFGEAYNEFAGPFAIISGQGSVSVFQDEKIIHIHMSLAKYETGETIGGHLIEADVLNTVEIYIGELSYQIRREIDPKLGASVVVTT